MPRYNFRRIAADHTDTSLRSWEDVEGPDSGCGLDYWLINKEEGLRVNLNIDGQSGELETVESFTEGEYADFLAALRAPRKSAKRKISCRR